MLQLLLALLSAAVALASWPGGNHQIVVKNSGWCYESRKDWIYNAFCYAPNPFQGFVYNAHSKTFMQEGQCLKSARAAGGQHLRLGSCHGHYQWEIEKGSHGTRIRLTSGNHLCIDVSGWAPKSLQKVQLWTCENVHNSDHWVRQGVIQKVVKQCLGDGCNRISRGNHQIVVARNTAMCYEVRNDYIWNEHCSNKPEQGFTYHSADRTFRFGHHHCLVVDRPDSGLQLRVGACTGNYQWIVEKGSHGDRIRLLNGDNKCIDVTGTHPSTSVHVILWTCEDFDNSDHWIKSGAAVGVYGH